TVFESATGILGNVQAVDPNDNSPCTYALTNDPSGMFAVDSTTGNVSLIDGKVFNAALQSSYAITVTATDDQSLSTDTTVTINVQRQDPLTRDIQVTFNLSDWSIYQDSTSSSFPGLSIPGFTGNQLTTTCLGPPTGANTYSEPWTANSLAFPEGIPLQFNVQYLGTLCTNANFQY